MITKKRWPFRLLFAIAVLSILLAAQPRVLIERTQAATVATTEQPPERPSFSIAAGSPSVDAIAEHSDVDPDLVTASILGMDPSGTDEPEVVFPAPVLGLQAGDDIDALSYGEGHGPDDEAPPLAPVLFSARGGATGLPGTELHAEARCAPEGAHVAGDEYAVRTPGTNTQVLDEDGIACSSDSGDGFPLGLLVGDDVDALDNLSPESLDEDEDGIPDAPVFFSLMPGSPTLATLEASPGAILVSMDTTGDGHNEVALFASAEELGLDDGDDIDALEMLENGNARYEPGFRTPDRRMIGDFPVFSLATGSPTLAGHDWRPGDLLAPNTGGDSALTLAFPAGTSGLAPEDDLNALKGDAPFLWRLGPYPKAGPLPGDPFGCTVNPRGGPEGWMPLAKLPIGREGGFATIIGDRIYVGHGASSFGDDSFHFVYDIPSDTWKRAASAPIGRAELTSVCAEDTTEFDGKQVSQGKVFVFGGRNHNPSSSISGVLDDVYAYNPLTNAWEPKTSMPTPRAGLGAAYVPSRDTVYVFGGRDHTEPHSGNPLDVVEAYHVPSDSWTSSTTGTLQPMPIPMMGIYSTVFDPTVGQEGIIFVIGGFDGTHVSGAVQAYDVASGTWWRHDASKPTPADMPTPRSNLLAGICGDRIHAIGGWDGTSEFAVNEAYDPAAKSWSTGPSPLLAPRSEFMTQGISTGRDIFAIGEGILGEGGPEHSVYTCGDPLDEPDIRVNPREVREVHFLSGDDTSGDEEVTVRNIGTQDLTIASVDQSDRTGHESEVDWLSWEVIETPTDQDEFPVTLDHGQRLVLEITKDCSTVEAVGQYVHYLKIESDDPDSATTLIRVELSCLEPAPVLTALPFMHVHRDSRDYSGHAAWDGPGDGATGVIVGIEQVVDQDGHPAPVNLQEYTAELHYDGSCMRVLEVRDGRDFRIDDVDIDHEAGVARFTGVNETGGDEPDSIMAFAPTRLVGDLETTCRLELVFTTLHDSDGNPLGIDAHPVIGRFRQGDARQDGRFNLVDVLFGALYLQGRLPGCEAIAVPGHPADRGCMNPVNLATIKPDGSTDRVSWADVIRLFFALRDSDPSNSDIPIPDWLPIDNN